MDQGKTSVWYSWKVVKPVSEVTGDKKWAKLRNFASLTETKMATADNATSKSKAWDASK